MAQSDGGSEQLDAQDIAILKEIADEYREQDDSGVSQSTRRKFLGLAGGSLVGAAGAGGYLTGQAQAGTQSVGQIGTQAEPADVYAEDFFDHNGNGVMSLPGDGSVSIEQLYNNAFPRIRVAIDGSEAVALTRSSELARSTNHASVIQAAIDEATVADPGQPLRYMPIGGIIDGQGYEYTISSGITLKDRLTLQNFHLNANGGTGYDILSSGMISGTHVKNVICHNSGDSSGLSVEPLFGCVFYNVAGLGNGGNGIECLGGISSSWYYTFTHGNGNVGLLIDDGANHGNDNHFFGGIISGNGTGTTACKMTKTSAPSEWQDNNTLHGIDFENADVGLDIAQRQGSASIEDCWFEGTSPLQVATTGACRSVTIEGNKAQSITVDANADRVELVRNSAEGGNMLDITVNSGATDTYLENNDLNGGSVTNNSSTTVIGGRRRSWGVPQNVTASRAFGTTYTNSANHDIWVAITIVVDGSTSGNMNAQLDVSQSGSFPSNDYRLDRVRLDSIASSDRVEFNLSGRVPSGASYSALSFGVETISQWVEWPLTA